MFLFTHTPTAIWSRSMGASSCLGQRVWNRPSWTTSTSSKHSSLLSKPKGERCMKN